MKLSKSKYKMKLLHAVFARLCDAEIRKLGLDILESLQMDFVLDKKWQIELLGRVIKQKFDGIIIYECSIDGNKNGWSIKKTNGILIALGTKYNNSLKGEHCGWWYKNGKLRWKGEYRDGHQDGEWRWWYENGQPHRYKIIDDWREIKYVAWNEKGDMLCHRCWA